LPTLNSIADIVSSQPQAAPEPVRVAECSSHPEFDLLCACCQPDPAAVAEALHGNLDWERFFALTRHHALLPAVLTALGYRDDVPASIRSAIRARFDAHCRRVLRFNAELARILQAFAESDTPVIAHKGPMLAQTLHGDPAMREFGDLDFLVRPGDVSQARSTLQRVGYEPQLQLTPGQERKYLQSGYEYVFGCGAEKNLVELQWQVVSRFYSVAFDLEELFQSSAAEQFEFRRTRVLNREDLLLVLCVHAAKHNWARLGMIRDITALLGFDLDWRQITSRARQLGIERILGISLRLARDLIGYRVLPALEFDDRHADEIAARVRAELAAGDEINVESVAYFRRMVQVRERWQDRIRFLWRLSITPSVGEWKAVRLPDALITLYPGVRAFRLLAKCATRVKDGFWQLKHKGITSPSAVPSE
jgi:Uncharacterised nucleotidyltransferase